MILSGDVNSIGPKGLSVDPVPTWVLGIGYVWIQTPPVGSDSTKPKFSYRRLGMPDGSKKG